MLENSSSHGVRVLNRGRNTPSNLPVSLFSIGATDRYTVAPVMWLRLTKTILELCQPSNFITRLLAVYLNESRLLQLLDSKQVQHFLNLAHKMYNFII